MSLVGETLLLIGGKKTETSYSADVQAINTTDFQWTTLHNRILTQSGNRFTARWAHASALFKDKVS